MTFLTYFDKIGLREPFIGLNLLPLAPGWLIPICYASDKKNATLSKKSAGPPFGHFHIALLCTEYKEHKLLSETLLVMDLLGFLVLCLVTNQPISPPRM